MESIQPSFFEGFLGGILYGLNLSDFAVPIGVLLWFLVSTLKLSKIDYSDVLTAGLYCLFSSFVGTLLVLVIPANFHSVSTMRGYFVFIVFFFLLSALRWTNLYITYKNSLVFNRRDKKNGKAS